MWPYFILFLVCPSSPTFSLPTSPPFVLCQQHGSVALECVVCDWMSATVWMDEWPCDWMNKWLYEWAYSYEGIQKSGGMAVCTLWRLWRYGHVPTHECEYTNTHILTYAGMFVLIFFSVHIVDGLFCGKEFCSWCWVLHAIDACYTNMWICRALCEFHAFLGVRMPRGVTVPLVHLTVPVVHLYTSIWIIIYLCAANVDRNEFMNCLCVC